MEYDLYPLARALQRSGVTEVRFSPIDAHGFARNMAVEPSNSKALFEQLGHQEVTGIAAGAGHECERCWNHAGYCDAERRARPAAPVSQRPLRGRRLYAAFT